MELKKIVSLGLLIFITVVNINVVFAENEKISLAEKNNTDKIYAVEGGNIYYSPSTGTITYCDDTVTSANIPATMPDGVKITSIGEWAFREGIDNLIDLLRN